MCPFLYMGKLEYYLKRSYAFTKASSAPIPRIASQFKIRETNGKHTVHEALKVVSSANMKINAVNAM